jgi:hypothetical protein
MQVGRTGNRRAVQRRHRKIESAVRYLGMSMTPRPSPTALCVASGACLIGTTALEGNIRCDSRLVGVESQRSDGGSVSDLHLRFFFALSGERRFIKLHGMMFGTVNLSTTASS